MSDSAAHLVDEVLPKVPVRQWVCSFPPYRGLRYAMGYDRELCSDILRAFVDSLRRSLRWRAKKKLGLRSVEDAKFGALTFIQRADSSLRLNPHFHTLALDGVYVEDEAGELHFHALGDPTPEDIAQVAAWTHARIERVLERHGRSLDGDHDAPDVLAQEQLALAMVYGACAGDRQLLGDAPGQRTRKVIVPVRELAKPKSNEGVAEVAGVNIHASAAIDGRDRRRLERLCRYVARPPISHKRLQVTSDGRVKYGFRPESRARWDLRGVAGPARLPRPSRRPDPAAELPYSASSKACSRPTPKTALHVVPGPALEPPEPAQLRLAFDGEANELERSPGAKRSSRHPWADLMQRVFAHEVLVCQRCRGDMRLVEVINDSDDIARVLAEAGLGPRPPPRPRPTPPGQLSLDFAA